MPGLGNHAAAQLLGVPRTALVGVAPDGSITLTAQVEPLLGYGDEELLGRPIETILSHPQFRGAGEQPAARFEVPCRRKDGSEMLAELSVFTVHTRSGPHLWAAIREAPEWRRAVMTHQLLAFIADSSSDAIISATLDSVITYWNAAAERLYGYTADEMVGASAEPLYVVGRPTEWAHLRQQLEAGHQVRLDGVPRGRKDGTIIKVSVTITPIFDDEGTVVAAASVTRDAGAADRAQARFSSLLEAATVAIVGLAADGRILLVNAEAERLFGYPRSELVGLPGEILVPEADRDIHTSLRPDSVAGPHPGPMSEGLFRTGRRKDGSEFPVEVALSTIVTEDGTLVCAAIRDLTQQIQREHLEHQSQQTRRLESLGQLAGGVAHDFNNLMAIIGGYAAFIRDGAEAGMIDHPHQACEAVLADIGKIEEAVERAVGLTRQLLAFGGREVTRPRLLGVNAVVRDAVTLLGRMLGEHITIVTRLAEDLTTVMADPGQIEQIIVNAAVNARDAMTTGGTLTIDTGNITLDEASAAQLDVPAGRYVRLRFIDTGSGMSEDTVNRAFEPFFTTKPPGEGIGLGLSTIYGIATNHGGHASIASGPRGTTLSILLPVRDEPAAAEVPPATPVQAVPEDVDTPLTVLVVDDEEDLRRVVERILTRRGHRVLVADDGVAAMALADRHPGAIDLLITDVIMPKMLGKTLAEAITRTRPDTHVLFMSGYARPVLAAQGTLDPTTALLEKPFTETELSSAVAVALHQPAAARA